MSLPTVLLADVDHSPGGADVITITFGDKTFRAGRRTAAHLLYTEERFREKFPWARIHVMQPCYNTGVDLSEGTHDGDGTLDFRVYGMDGSEAQWWEVQRLFRECGWDAWFRHTGPWSARSKWHIHANSDGCPGEVGFYIPDQNRDYENHTFGLAGQHNVDADKSRFPGDVGAPPWPKGTPAQWRAAIRAVRFNFAEWEENHMDQKTKEELADMFVAKLMAYKPGNDDDTVKQILNRLSTDQERE